MHQLIENKIQQLTAQYCARKNQSNLWREPIVRFADAADPGFLQLRQIVTPDHHLPQDYLPRAKTVLSWFLPFLPELGQENLSGDLSAARWADAYLVTNEMAGWINEQLVLFLKETYGAESAVPTDAGMISMANPRSRWSQRHVAYLAGHGTFGKNNMLISDSGAMGRYFSIVTALETVPDKPVMQERCLWKRDGSCGLCMYRCKAGALTEAGFDRFRCLEQCLINMERYPGADVCGKCTVELPCSYAVPGEKERNV